MQFIIFTKTRWLEPPRLRHQLVKLLLDAGHTVTFYEKPYYPWQRVNTVQTGINGLSLRNTKQLIHHKLRINFILGKLNEIFEIISIKQSSIEMTGAEVIINFNYDYYFLRKIFPGLKIITILNDDSWSKSILGSTSFYKFILKKTCLMSNVVSSVSPAISSQINHYCSPKLFFPWADKSYQNPKKSENKYQLLFWGFINYRLDYEYLKGLVEYSNLMSFKLEIILVGPMPKELKEIKKIKKIPKISFKPTTALEELSLTNVFGAIIPYRDTNNPDIEPIFLPNKGLQLLARGLPLVITGMPNFIVAPFVFRLGQSLQKDLIILANVKKNFENLQKPIKRFVNQNSSRNRLDQILEWV